MQRTPRDHASFQSNKAAVLSLSDIATFLNDCIARDYRMKKILEIQQRLFLFFSSFLCGNLISSFFFF